MLGLLLLVASIGLADSLNPSTIGPALVIATDDDAVPRLAAFTAGVFLVSTVAGLVVVLGPGQALLDAMPTLSARAKHVAEVAGGVVVLGLAVLAWRGRRRLQRDMTKHDDRREKASGVVAAFGVGAGIMALELPTAFPYFAALAAILAARSSTGRDVALVVAYNVAFVTPLLLILGIRVLAGKEADDRLERVRTWIARRAGLILAALLGAAGVALLGFGAAGLAG